MEVWLRKVLLPFVYSLQLTSVVGALKKENPSGGYSLVIPPATGGGSAPVASTYRGQWTATPPSPYMEFHIVLLITGTAAGTYLSTIDNNTNDPATGIGWVQIAPGDAFGRWG